MPRCPNGSRKNKKTGKCEKVGSQKRCPKGTRKNKKTGNCEEKKSVEKPKEDELALLKKELKDDYESSYRFVRSTLYDYMEEYVDMMNEEKNFGMGPADDDTYISKREFNEFIDKNIKSIYIITKRVDNEETESDMVDRIRPFFKKVEEFIYNHEQ